MAKPWATGAIRPNASVAPSGVSGRSTPRWTRAPESRHAVAGAGVIAAPDGGAAVAGALAAPYLEPHRLVPPGRPMTVREVATRRVEPRRRPVDPTIVALVPHAAAGDRAAFTRLVEAFHADMARVAYLVCGGDRELAEDAVQSAWAIAWSRLGSLRDAEGIRAWLLSVAANEARQMLRHQRPGMAVRLEYAEERVGAPDPHASADALDMAAVLARLKPEERTLVGLRYAAGLDSAEIGAVLGMSASGVRSRLDRLLDRLRAELDHE